MLDYRPLVKQIACCGVLVALSVAYYSRYADAGFNYADDGNYAQICYELLHGRDLHELSVNYGILWFKIGELMFRLFGVNFAHVQALFFACITVTNLLVFAAVVAFTGSAVAALVIALVPLLVPAFPATSFYGLCVLLNVAAQIRFAGRLTTANAAVAGAALSLTFQLRPDFGYSFAVPLALLLAMAAWQGAPWRRLVTAAAGGFVVTFLPMIVAAVAGGYLDLIVQQAIDYPRLMVTYFAGGLARVVGDAATTPAATFLARPSPATIFGDDAATAQLALLIYLPLVGVTAFAVYVAATWRQCIAAKRWDVMGQSVVAFCAAAATLPHYFLFRPDMAHIANFTGGYVVLIAFFLWRLSRELATGAKHGRMIGTVIASVLAFNVAVYVVVGLNSRGTGSIGLAADRIEPFRAANGINVRVDAAENTQLTFLRDVIARASRPGDSIVCLPYCPGIAFMADRQMLLGEFFADDSFPARMPGWLPQIIARTRAARPPVVVVIDWATNATERSRFSVWAADYVAAMEGLAMGKIVRGAVTVYLVAPHEPEAPQPAEKPGSP